MDVVVPAFPRVGRWDRINYHRYPVGDGRVPEISAILDSSNSTAVPQKHGALFHSRDAQANIRRLLCDQGAVAQSVRTPPGPAIFVEMDEVLYRRQPQGRARVRMGVVDHGEIVGGMRVNIAIRTEDNQTVSTAETGGTGNRLIDVEISVPENVGGYALEVSSEARNVRSLETAIEYFGVINDEVCSAFESGVMPTFDDWG